MEDLRLISLVGLPAVGKSTIGRRLAAALLRSFFDTDDLVEKAAMRSIAAIFQQDGEQGFRELEAEALEEIARMRCVAVIATGGGIVTFERSHKFLAGNAYTIYLRSTPELLVQRLARSNKRPLFRSGGIAAKVAQLHEERDALYREVARMVVDVDRVKSIDVVASILSRLPGTHPA